MLPLFFLGCKKTELEDIDTVNDSPQFFIKFNVISATNDTLGNKKDSSAVVFFELKTNNNDIVMGGTTTLNNNKIYADSLTNKALYTSYFKINNHSISEIDISISGNNPVNMPSEADKLTNLQVGNITLGSYNISNKCDNSKNGIIYVKKNDESYYLITKPDTQSPNFNKMNIVSSTPYQIEGSNSQRLIIKATFQCKLFNKDFSRYLILSEGELQMLF